MLIRKGLPRWLWRRTLGKPMILGLDFSGSVVAVGGDIRNFHLGDHVMGAVPLRVAYAQYLEVRPTDKRTAIALKPEHDVAEVLPFAGLVAYAGLVSHGGLDPSVRGAKILIVGASDRSAETPLASLFGIRGSEHGLQPSQKKRLASGLAGHEAGNTPSKVRVRALQNRLRKPMLQRVAAGRPPLTLS